MNTNEMYNFTTKYSCKITSLLKKNKLKHPDLKIQLKTQVKHRHSNYSPY